VSKIIKLFQIFFEYIFDICQFIYFNRYSPFVNKQKKLFYNLLINAHSIEKGLSLNKPRYLFGKEKIKYIINNLKLYNRQLSKIPIEMSLGALAHYVILNKKIKNDDFLDYIELFISNYNKKNLKINGGAVKIKNNNNGIFFRSSSRVFNSKKISNIYIQKLVELTKKAPSQCNRQSTKLHLYQNKKTINTLLSMQGGANSFKNKIGNLFIITSDLTAWGGPGERNQLYVDGSLLAMNLLISATYMKFDTCPLNLAKSNYDEYKIKKIGKIPNNEKLIMMIAIGFAVKNRFKAVSVKRDNSEVLKIH